MANKQFIAQQMNRFFQIMTQQMQLDDTTAMEIADLYEPWEIGKNYEVGRIVKYGVNADSETQLYTVIQAHTSQANWTPDTAVSMFKAVGFTDSGVSVWTQPLSIADGATYYDGVKKVPAWVRKKKWIVSSVSGDRAVIDKSVDGKNAICSPINVKFLTVDGAKIETPKTETFKSYLAKVTASALNIRKGAGTNFAVTGVIRDKGTYTIVAESKGKGSTKGWGNLKSGAGWISLDFVKKV